MVQSLPAVTHVFLLLCALLLNAAAQIGVFRAIQGLSAVKSLLAGFAVGFTALFVAECVLLPELSLDAACWVVIDLATYVCASYGYFHFVNVGDASVRLRVLSELQQGGPRGLTVSELLARYNARTIVDLRLERLIASQQIFAVGDHYVAGKPRLLFAAKVVQLHRRLVLGTNYRERLRQRAK